jgi:cytoskeletal protein RodZ
LVYLLLVVAAVILIAAIAYGTQRKSRDGVASFKRQIDALSPEARKPVVDQVQSVSDLRRSSDSANPGTTSPGTTSPGTTDPGTTDPGAATADPSTNDSGTPDSADSSGVTADEPADEPEDSADGS